MTLRQKTGMGMMDCKTALAENEGDMKEAEQWLRAKVKGKMESRTERATGEGRIGIAIDDGDAAIVEVRTESDFTAKNADFIKMVDDVTKSALSQPPGSITPTDDMAERIDDQRVTTRENVNFARGEKLEGGSFGGYVHHDGKRACLLQIDGDADDSLLKGICQHIVFHDPAGISEEDVEASTLDTIRSEALAEATSGGKPAEIAEKIAQGKVRKYLEESTLLNQKYVLDESKMVKDVLHSTVKVKRFVRYTLGSD
jgi:elongation factor Ts